MDWWNRLSNPERFAVLAGSLVLLPILLLVKASVYQYLGQKAPAVRKHVTFLMALYVAATVFGIGVLVGKGL